MSLLDVVFEHNPLNDLGQTVWARDLSPLLPSRHYQPEDHGEGALSAQAPLGFPSAVPNRRKDTFDRVRSPDVLPVLGREVIEGQQLRAILNQLGGGFLVFHAVGIHEETEGGIGLFLCLGHPDILQISLGFFVQGFGHRALDIRRFVDPTSLLACVGKDIAQRRPEPESPIVRGQFGRHSQAALFQPFQQIAPTVSVFTEPVHDGENVLLVVFVCTDNHQHTLTITVRTRRKVDPIRSDVDVALAREIALAPTLVFFPLVGLQSRDG